MKSLEIIGNYSAFLAKGCDAKILITEKYCYLPGFCTLLVVKYQNFTKSIASGKEVAESLQSEVVLKSFKTTHGKAWNNSVLMM